METATATPRPFTRPQDYYQLRDFGQKFEATINFFKLHGGNLYRVLLVAFIPLILAVIVMALGALPMLRTMGTGIGQRIPRGSQLDFITGTMGVALAGAVVLFGLAFLLMTVLIYGFIKRRMENPDPQAPLTLGEVWEASSGHLLPLLGQGIVAYVLLVFATLLLILPGIYLGVALALFPCVRVFEQAGLGQAISRPLQLIQGKWWSTFGLIFVGSMAIGLVAAVLAGIVGLLVGITSDAPLSLDSPGIAAYSLARLLINYAAYPVLYVLIAFQYFNLVERRDGVSLQWKIDQLGQTPAAADAERASDDSLFRPSYGDQTY